MADVQVGDREEEVFLASGSERTRTAVVLVTIAVPAWDDISAEDVLQEYARWLADDPDDAVRGTSVRWQDDDAEVPLVADVATDEEDEQ